MRSYFITHPEVEIDPAVPIERWALSSLGRSRADALAKSGLLDELDAVVSSAEAKARETADFISSHSRLDVVGHADLGENDRSATGFLPSTEFEAAADAFFAHPTVSFRGWETAEAAQARISGAVRRIATVLPDRSIGFVSHGAVGSLLWCALTGTPISRGVDQPRQGCWYEFDPETWTAESSWAPFGTA